MWPDLRLSGPTTLIDAHWPGKATIITIEGKVHDCRARQQ
ncbi:hypothetical protein SAMN06297144_1414 [Sphingomonas guangdongensis]|uniref:Uncharacterized protein n=1 Tax=Sphingomonas guangdongensis TaxID=1141890 RepID=A0A285QI23_9SPHN|nr:hypothetical protein SAMN06297144_1414 [Sphingomonas guangdongensis]